MPRFKPGDVIKGDKWTPGIYWMVLKFVGVGKFTYERGVVDVEKYYFFRIYDSNFDFLGVNKIFRSHFPLDLDLWKSIPISEMWKD